MLCDACNVRPEWKGEHKCHTPGYSAEMTVQGKPSFGRCECSVSGVCRPPTDEELKAFRKLNEWHWSQEGPQEYV